MLVFIIQTCLILFDVFCVYRSNLQFEDQLNYDCLCYYTFGKGHISVLLDFVYLGSFIVEEFTFIKFVNRQVFTYFNYILKRRRSYLLNKGVIIIQEMDQPIIEEEHNNTIPEPIQVEHTHQEQKMEEEKPKEEEIKLEVREHNGFVEEVRIGDQTLFSLKQEAVEEEQKQEEKERRTRWGERQIKRSKIQEDAVFNPLEAMYHGKTLLPITQYGQAELEIKMALYSDGKRRKSKWHHEIEKTFTPPLINYVSPTISVDQIQYILRLFRLDELNSQMNNFVPEDPDLRSQSPQPIYDNQGKRINTREVRKRDTFMRERIALIEDCMKMRKSFVPPSDYKPLKKFKKIYLSENAINDSKANYIGKIIGPGGRTQKLIEQRSGARIAVRGRGANKQAKDIFENYEPLHIIIVADKEEELQKGVEEVEKILNGDEDQELKELLDSYNQQIQGIYQNYCDNCQQEGHRTWACPFQAKNKVNIKCTICGETSHPTSDCPEKQAYLQKQQSDQIAMLLENQYNQFKEDLNIPKPKGGMAFITDFERKDALLAIAHGKAQEVKAQNQPLAASASNSAAVALAPPPPQNSDLPKFQDE